ncbi:hypothetical protein SynRS9909_01740 [Synechococcus sp. RS9909]|nr:hypothetical protein RS9917_11280 [Synechococcus sp. RS9917]QNI79723.1 hypothetical protein SynRS9909_01740 [Synechococcus sp. RS9909]
MKVAAQPLPQILKTQAGWPSSLDQRGDRIDGAQPVEMRSLFLNQAGTQVFILHSA